MDATDLINEVKSGSLKYYNFYNTDLGLATYFGAQYYLENKTDTIDNYTQNLHIVFFDIEVYKDRLDIRFDFSRSDFPISAITLYSTRDKIFKCYLLLIDENRDSFNSISIEDHIADYKLQLLEKEYYKDENEINIEIKTFNKELDLILEFWKDLRIVDPMFLGGFNSRGFDIPYCYRRTLLLIGDKEETDSIISRFNYVDYDGKLVKIPEYSCSDIQYMYKLRADGGLNYGRKLPSYSLDSISDFELKLKKFEYKSVNKNLDEFYRNDVHNYLLYNVIDVDLTQKLNNKLKHLELHTLIRRMEYAPYTKSLVGNSALFDSYILYKLLKDKKLIRHGMNSENAMIFDQNEFSDIFIPKTNKGVINAIPITARDYRGVVSRFDGASVLSSKSRIVNSGLIMDLDATSLYPSMLLQSNVGLL